MPKAKASDFSTAQEALIGRVPAGQVAEHFGMSGRAVQLLRLELGIIKPGPMHDYWTGIAGRIAAVEGRPRARFGEITRKRRGELSQAVFRILDEAGGVLGIREVLARMPERVPPTPFEETEYYPGSGRRYERIIKFGTIGPVKAGWLEKVRKGNTTEWTLLPAGREALERYPDPVEFELAVGAEYRAWLESTGKRPPKKRGAAPTKQVSPSLPTAIFDDPASSHGAPLFKTTTHSVAGLVQDIRKGVIGLPDIQRPFLWENTQVRDLLDSMYKGFPVGALLLWQVTDPSATTIGADSKQSSPSMLIVDGQQRLTSLYAVRTGTPVRRKGHAVERIKIAFRPADRRFEVSTPIIERDGEWISDISALWAKETAQYNFITDFLERQRNNRSLTAKEEKALSDAINHLYGVDNYVFTALELQSGLDEEFVADIFVRINSQGKKLNAADFILTLMSVYQEEGRKELEAFARAAKAPSAAMSSPFNYILQPSPSDLLRVSVALGFRRARLKDVYALLRGKDISKDGWDPARRTEQFERLANARAATTDLTNWHEFLKAIKQAGFRRDREIASSIALLYSYAFFLIGLVDFGVDLIPLRACIARWFFMAQLSGRYTGATETTMEQDLAQLRLVRDAKGFIALLDGIVEETLGGDFWSLRLPRSLETTAARGAGWAAFAASLVLLDAPVLFSHLKVETLFDPSAKAKKAAAERHHLFPKNWLTSQGVDEKQIDQIANLAFVEWPVNLDISDAAPSEYWKRLAPTIGKASGEIMRLHALPADWPTLPYEDFLVQRRDLMASVIQEGFRRLGGRVKAREAPSIAPPTSAVVPLDTATLIARGEGSGVEFKESARWSWKPPALDPLTNQPRPILSEQDGKLSVHAIAKSVAGFMNAAGGTLFIGVADDGSALGIQEDLDTFQRIEMRTTDQYQNWLTEVLKDTLGGPVALQWLTIAFEEISGVLVCRIDVKAAPTPIYVGGSRLFVRTLSTTREFTTKEALEYFDHRRS